MRLKTVTKSILVMLITIFLLLTILVVYNGITDKRLRNEWGNIVTDTDYDKVLKLDKFPISKQLYSWSCGPTTISMIYTYLKGPKNEKQILDENGLTNRNAGMFPKTFEKYLRASLQGYRVELKNDITDSDVIKTVYNQVKQGLPVPIYFSTVNDWDKPNYHLLS